VASILGSDSTDTWASTGITYTVELDSPAEPVVLQQLLAKIDVVAEIPHAIRQGVPVRTNILICSGVTEPGIGLLMRAPRRHGWTCTPQRVSGDRPYGQPTFVHVPHPLDLKAYAPALIRMITPAPFAPTSCSRMLPALSVVSA
jgi:hypothetical protein